MSSRQIRRLMALKEASEKEKKKNEKPDDEEQEDTPADEPYAQQSQTFQGLEVSSESESENRARQDPSPSTSPIPGTSSTVLCRSVNVPEEDKYGAKKKTYTPAELAKKEKKKPKRPKNFKQSFNVPGMEQVDEIEWLSEQMNLSMGFAPQRVEEMVVDKKEQRKQQLFYINPNHLDVNNELAKVYGTKDKKSPSPLGRRASHWIGVSPEIQGIKIKGIIMTRYSTDGRVKFFRFSHNQEYRSRCHELIRKVRQRLHGVQVYDDLMYPITCLEACIENCDILYGLEEHAEGRLSLEQCLFCFQYVADTSFSYADGNTRLLYEFVENRPFLIALLKYIHILSNTACYITALALGKVLLSLDPQDPLCMLFIIDTLAIRAREFKWLLSLIEAWRETRHAHLFFNMRYSRALAILHVTRRAKESEDEADVALKKAIISYPTVILKIAELARIPVPDDIKKHVVFNPPADYPVPCPIIQKLMDFYAWLIAPRWREPFITKWVLRVLRQITEQYDASPELRKKTFDGAVLVVQLYRKCPTELNRHLYSIKMMANYMGGGYMPIMEPTVAFNPYPTKGLSVDTYDYFTQRAPPPPPNRNALMGFLDGLSPNFRLGAEQLVEVLCQVRSLQEIYDNNTYQWRMVRPPQERDTAPLQGPPPVITECEEVPIRYRRTIVHDDDYFTETIFTDEEKEYPLCNLQVFFIFYITGMQLAYYLHTGSYIWHCGHISRGLIESPLD